MSCIAGEGRGPAGPRYLCVHVPEHSLGCSVGAFGDLSWWRGGGGRPLIWFAQDEWGAGSRDNRRELMALSVPFTT